MEQNNHYRARIINECLLEYIDVVKTSDRNREIVEKYVRGSGFGEISKVYNLSYSRIRGIVYNYILHASRIKKQEGIKMICPICGKEYTERPALSRKDDKTEICPICSSKEAMIAAGWTEEMCDGAMNVFNNMKRD